MGGVHALLKERGDRGEFEWAVLRPTWFQGMFFRLNLLHTAVGRGIAEPDHWKPPENISEQSTYRDPIAKENKIYSAAAEGKLPLISANDIAACAKRLLLAPEPPNADFILVGPEPRRPEILAKLSNSFISC
jgi:festuclavine dehydrogenase